VRLLRRERQVAGEEPHRFVIIDAGAELEKVWCEAEMRIKDFIKR